MPLKATAAHTHTLVYPAASSCAAVVYAHSQSDLLRRPSVLVSPQLAPLLATTWLLSAAGGGVKGQNIYNPMQLQMGRTEGG